MLRAGVTVASALSTSRCTWARGIIRQTDGLASGAAGGGWRATRLHPSTQRSQLVLPRGFARLSGRGPRGAVPRLTAAKPGDGADSIYADPELYEAAFSRNRDVLAETHFIVDVASKTLGRRPESFLELACGPARHAVEAARQGLRAAALDASPAMAAYARANAAQAGVELAVVEGDMRDCGAALGEQRFDLACILLGSLSHVLTTEDALRCFRGVHGALSAGGVLVVELPNPSELFDGSLTGDPQRWTSEFGALRATVKWGSTRDKLDPITQVLYRKVVVKVEGPNAAEGALARAIEAIVPTRLYTVPELRLLGELSGLRLAELHGDLEPGIAADAEDAGRLVAVFQKGAGEDEQHLP